ncbi:MAG: hypothetical protein NT043_03280 [Candidatus Bathyarchaeota archaeon]|nr:hypothetical protein [Candidatus Bathyarchaeota archaeon]
MSYDENAVLDIIEKVTKSVVNISTLKLVHNIFYLHKRKISEIVRILVLRNGRELFFELKLSEAP